MAFEPMTQIITEIGKWGQKNGKSITEAFCYEGDWSGWAQVELALYFRDYENVNVSRNQTLSSGQTVDLLMTIEGGKNIAAKLICEQLPPGKGSKGDDTVWEKIKRAYDELVDAATENTRPVAMGIVVSDIGNDSTKYHLCDKNLFDQMPMYTPKIGYQVNLYFRWI